MDQQTANAGENLVHGVKFRHRFVLTILCFNLLWPLVLVAVWLQMRSGIKFSLPLSYYFLAAVVASGIINFVATCYQLLAKPPLFNQAVALELPLGQQNVGLLALAVAVADVAERQALVRALVVEINTLSEASIAELKVIDWLRLCRLMYFSDDFADDNNGELMHSYREAFCALLLRYKPQAALRPVRLLLKFTRRSTLGTQTREVLNQFLTTQHTTQP